MNVKRYERRRESSLADTFEVRGRFWVPDDPERRVDGTVYCRPGDSPWLNLVRRFPEELEGGPIPGPHGASIPLSELATHRQLIHGEDLEGNPLSLGQCRPSMPPFGHRGNYACLFLFLGAHLPAGDPVLESVRIEYAGVSGFFESGAMAIEAAPERGPKTEVRLEYKVPPSLTTEVDRHWSVQVDYAMDFGEGAWLFNATSFSLEERTSLTITPHVEQRATDLLSFQRACRQFLVFATGRPVWPVWVEGCVGETVVGVYFRIGAPPSRSREETGPFRLTMVPHGLECLGLWLRKRDELQTVYDLLEAAIEKPETGRAKFLDLAQALEVYHREVVDPKRMSLATRLDQLLGRLAPVASEAVEAINPPNVDGSEHYQSWPKRIGDIRNAWTHHSGPRGYQSPAGWEVRRLIDQMRIVLELNLMLFDLGFDPSILDALGEWPDRYRDLMFPPPF